MIGYETNQHEGRRLWRLAATPAVIALGLVPAIAAPAAGAGTCVEQVDEMAAAHDLAVDPPDARGASPTPGEGPRDLGKSGGVIEPPRVDDPAVIEPREGVRYGMPTVPELAPDASSSLPDGRAATLNAQDRAILESLLIAARAEGERGNEADCFRKLQMAQEFLEDKT